MILTKLFSFSSGVYKEGQQDRKLRGDIHVDKAIMCVSVGLMLSILLVKALDHWRQWQSSNFVQRGQSLFIQLPLPLTASPLYAW